MKKSARSSCIDDKFGPKRRSSAFLYSPKGDPVCIFRQRIQPDLIHIINAGLLRLLDQKCIEVSTIPVSVRDSVMWACRYKKLISTPRIGSISLTEHVMIKSKTSLQAAWNLRMMLLPAPPFRQRLDGRQVVSCRKIFKQQVRERSR